MSNYPLPPTPPPPGPLNPNSGAYPPAPPPPSDALAPARRAATMLWIVGGLGLLCGICVVSAFSLLPHDQLVQAMHSGMAKEQNEFFSQVPVDTMLLQAKVQATLVVVFAATMVASAFGVYRAKRPAIIVALIPCVLILLSCGLNLLLSLVLLARGAVAPAVLNFIVVGFIAAIFGVTVRWLIQGFSVSAKAAEEQTRQMQYWYYQQQQQQAAGYGYGPQAVPQPPPSPQPWMTPPPPPPANPPSTSAAPPQSFTPPPPPSSPGGAGEGPDEPGM